MKFVNISVFLIIGCCIINNCLSFEELGKQNEKRNVCLNNSTVCGPQATCCPDKYSNFRCCRYSNAVCCNDKLHCCPEGTSCNVQQKRCDRPLNDVMEWPVLGENDRNQLQTPKYTFERKSIADMFIKLGLKNICPDGGVCPGLQTCCLMLDGSYGCCQFQSGVCCPDKMTCCSAGYTCVPGGCA